MPGRTRMKKKAPPDSGTLSPTAYITGTDARERVAVARATRGVVGTTTVKSSTQGDTQESPKSPPPRSLRMTGAMMS